jgi:hypothetical protein
LPYRAAVVGQDFRQRRDGFFLAVDHLAGDAILDDLGDRPAAERQYRRAARHSFDHYESKRFRPVHRDQKSSRVAEELCFLALVDLADELHVRTIEEWAYLGAEVVFVDLVHLGRDLQRD